MNKKQILGDAIRFIIIGILLFGTWLFGYWQGSIGFNNINYTSSGDINPDKLFENYGGFYNYNDQYYCVWTKGRSYKEINHTEDHEICHYLIDEDYNHFCK